MAVVDLSRLLDLQAIQAERGRRSLKYFAVDAWSIIEPIRFVDGWVVDCLCEHLEAVTSGQIRKLLINVPPRHSKSSLLVLWRVWTWLQNPAERFLAASYSLSLSIRDNLRVRRIIEDTWFQDRYGDKFQLAADQNLKSYFENTANGYQMSISVGSGTTGHGGSFLVCLCYNTEVTTDQGRLCIGDIVERHLPVRVLAFDHKHGQARWQSIEEYEVTPGRASVRVTFSDGRFIEATTDHPFYVVGKGYVQAAYLINGDEVITDESCLRVLQEGVQSQSIRNCQVQTTFLQPHVSLCGSIQGESSSLPGSTQDVDLSGMQKRIRAINRARCTSQGDILQQSMLRSVGERQKQSCLSRRLRRTKMRTMRRIILGQTIGGCCWSRPLLLTKVLPCSSGRGKFTFVSSHFRLLCILRRKNTCHCVQVRQTQFLFSQVCQPCPQRAYQRGKQRTLHRRIGAGTISTRIYRDCSIGARTRQSSMSTLPDDTRGKWQRVRCPSCRLRQEPQRTWQSCLPLPLLSWQDARFRGTKSAVEILLVGSVEPIPTPERVYNLRIAHNHNYFANGVLVHNCDDPHNASEAHSEADREAALSWFREVWTNRLNDQERDKMVTVGQRIHENDVCGYILRERPDWIHLNLSAFYEPSRHCTTPIWSDPRRQEGELLWPERFSKETLDGLHRDLGSSGFSAQYQQLPTPAGGGQFKEKWFRYFEIEGENYTLHTPEGDRHIPIAQCWKFVVVDLAISLKTDADFTVIQCWVVTEDNDALLLDQHRDRLDNPEQQQAIKAMYYLYKPNFVEIESVAYQLAIIQQLLREAIPCREYKPVRDKVSRASTASILMEQGKVYFKHQAPWLEVLKSELLHFPLAEHDDCVDTCSMAADIVTSQTIPQHQVQAMQRRAELAKQRASSPVTQNAMLPQKKGWWE